jgi:hypothetical protein
MDSDEQNPHVRMAQALETIADCLLKLVNPPIVFSSQTKINTMGIQPGEVTYVSDL